jgi:hypothetical protein
MKRTPSISGRQAILSFAPRVPDFGMCFGPKGPPVEFEKGLDRRRVHHFNPKEWCILKCMQDARKQDEAVRQLLSTVRDTTPRTVNPRMFPG